MGTEAPRGPSAAPQQTAAALICPPPQPWGGGGSAPCVRSRPATRASEVGSKPRARAPGPRAARTEGYAAAPTAKDARGWRARDAPSPDASTCVSAQPRAQPAGTSHQLPDSATTSTLGRAGETGKGGEGWAGGQRAGRGHASVRGERIHQARGPEPRPTAGGIHRQRGAGPRLRGNCAERP